ncbi:unnamed protein product [Didymodactylos carnosus]|uniref:NADH dehydrogenase [ubiquinone] 1 beta subcomplex subunit 7 n=1 Tax=Didymodactylos carnosus TaxID=1234261 RepID=A0A813Z800_9BILA|nr:unnamed protein product [Didymodactylos carnosus]CAF3679463.1 unnamed protein product [Didymodactylos carnosus]
MGLGYSIDRYRHPEKYPNIEAGPTFDPLYGFPEGRKTKTSPYTPEEMARLSIPLDHRDYCAHYYRAIMLCYAEYQPRAYRYCNPEKHAYHECLKEDRLDVIKEHERERRLRLRRIRKDEKENREKRMVELNDRLALENEHQSNDI